MRTRTIWWVTYTFVRIILSDCFPPGSSQRRQGSGRGHEDGPGLATGWDLPDSCRMFSQRRKGHVPLTQRAERSHSAPGPASGSQLQSRWCLLRLGLLSHSLLVLILVPRLLFFQNQKSFTAFSVYKMIYLKEIQKGRKGKNRPRILPSSDVTTV